MTYEEERAQIIETYHRQMELLQIPRPPSRLEQFVDDYIDAFERIFEELITIPPFSWLNRLLGGPVRPSK
jgi:hypothetical protein